MRKFPFPHMLTSEMQVCVESLRELAREFPDTLPPDVAKLEAGDVFLHMGVPILIVTQAEAEATGGVVVCERFTGKSDFKDDLRGVCMQCRQAVRFRPYMPKLPKLCSVCADAAAAKKMLAEGTLSGKRKEWNN